MTLLTDRASPQRAEEVTNTLQYIAQRSGTLLVMVNRVEIVDVKRDDGDGLIVTFSDGTTAGYVAEELIQLRPNREPLDVEPVLVN